MQILGKNNLISFFLMATPVGPAFALDLLHGHFEIQTDYQAGTGWWLGPTYNQNDDFNDRSQVRRLDPATTRIVAPPKARVTGSASTTFLLPAGQPLWLLNQGFQVGNHFLGMRTLFNPGVFQTRVHGFYSNAGSGSISLRLVSVNGSGPDRGGKFALWKSDPFSGPEIFFNTNDGITAADEVPTLSPNNHSHFNWGFTKPGEYRITFQAYGRLLGSGTPTSKNETFTFIVPHSGALSALDAELCESGMVKALVPGDRAVGVAYGPRRSFVVSTAATGGPSGAAWQCPLRLAADGWSVPDHAGIASALTARGATSDVVLRLTGHRGPGEVIALDSSGGTLFDSSDGFGPGDQVDLGAGPATGTLYFTSSGLHTLEFATASGASGEGFAIRCGAGLPIGYTFAQWADSHERTHSLPPGALANPAGDFNGDGRSHRLEYLLDAAGVSPVTGGSATRASRESGTGFGRMIFLRDLHKDTLTGSGFQLQSGFSENFTGWAYLTATNVGFPLGFFETGADEGNARSLLMMRALRHPVPASGRGFYRLRDQ